MREIYPQPDYPRIFMKSKRVVDGPALHRSWGVLFRDTEYFGFGERIMMPLANDGIKVDGILGATEYAIDYIKIRAAMSSGGDQEQWFEL